MVALCPELGIGDVPCDRPTVGTIALPAELNALHHGIEKTGLRQINTVFDLDHDGPAPRAEIEPHLGVGNGFQCLLIVR